MMKESIVHDERIYSICRHTRELNHFHIRTEMKREEREREKIYHSVFHVNNKQHGSAIDQLPGRRVSIFYIFSEKNPQNLSTGAYKRVAYKKTRVYKSNLLEV